MVVPEIPTKSHPDPVTSAVFPPLFPQFFEDAFDPPLILRPPVLTPADIRPLAQDLADPLADIPSETIERRFGLSIARNRLRSVTILGLPRTIRREIPECQMTAVRAQIDPGQLVAIQLLDHDLVLEPREEILFDEGLFGITSLVLHRSILAIDPQSSWGDEEGSGGGMRWEGDREGAGWAGSCIRLGG